MKYQHKVAPSCWGIWNIQMYVKPNHFRLYRYMINDIVYEEDSETFRNELEKLTIWSKLSDS